MTNLNMNVVSSDEECSDAEYDLMRVRFITGLPEDELECRPGEPGWDNYVRVVGLRSGNDDNRGGGDNGETDEEEEEEDEEESDEEEEEDEDDDEDDDDEEDDEEESSEEEEFSEEEDDEEEDDEDIFEEDEWIMEKAPLHEIVSQEYMESQFRCTVCRSLGSEFLDCRICEPALGAKYMNKLSQDEIDEYMQMTWDEHNLLMDRFT